MHILEMQAVKKPVAGRKALVVHSDDPGKIVQFKVAKPSLIAGSCDSTFFPLGIDHLRTCTLMMNKYLSLLVQAIL